MELNLFIDALMKTASLDQEGLFENAHRFDELIMSNWPTIREQAIKDGLFSADDAQETLFQRINGIVSKSVQMNAILSTVHRKFVTGDKDKKVLLDAFEDDYMGKKPKHYRAVNPLEFWLVIQQYAAYAKKSNENCPPFEQLVVASVLHSPSAGGYVANLFANTAAFHYFSTRNDHVLPESLLAQHHQQDSEELANTAHEVLLPPNLKKEMTFLRVTNPETRFYINIPGDNTEAEIDELKKFFSSKGFNEPEVSKNDSGEWRVFINKRTQTELDEWATLGVKYPLPDATLRQSIDLLREKGFFVSDKSKHYLMDSLSAVMEQTKDLVDVTLFFNPQYDNSFDLFVDSHINIFAGMDKAFVERINSADASFQVLAVADPVVSKPNPMTKLTIKHIKKELQRQYAAMTDWGVPPAEILYEDQDVVKQGTHIHKDNKLLLVYLLMKSAGMAQDENEISEAFSQEMVQFFTVTPAYSALGVTVKEADVRKAAQSNGRFKGLVDSFLKTDDVSALSMVVAVSAPEAVNQSHFSTFSLKKEGKKLIISIKDSILGENDFDSPEFNWIQSILQNMFSSPDYQLEVVRVKVPPQEAADCLIHAVHNQLIESAPHYKLNLTTEAVHGIRVGIASYLASGTLDANAEQSIKDKEDSGAIAKVDKIKAAVDKAVKNYGEWYKGESQHRGPNGFFSWLRHGQKGQEKARQLNEDLSQIDSASSESLDRCATLINNFLSDKNTRYHRHSLASFILDELKTLKDSPWGEIECLPESNLYAPRC